MKVVAGLKILGLALTLAYCFLVGYQLSRLYSIDTLSTTAATPENPAQTTAPVSHFDIEFIKSKYPSSHYVFWNASSLLKFHDLPNFQFCRWRNGKPHKRPKTPLPEYLLSEHQQGKPHQHNSTSVATPYLLHLQLHCHDVLVQNGFGTGNWVQSLYLLRYAVAEISDSRVTSPKVDLLLTCSDADTAASTTVLSWLMGYYPSPSKWNYSRERPDCNDRGEWGWLPHEWVLPHLRKELQRMATGLVVGSGGDSSQKVIEGAPSSSFNHQLAVPLLPLLDSIEVDDVAIHFRCGDVIMNPKVKYFRFLKFSAITQYISFANTTSIGIVTQPFKPTKQARRMDLENGARTQVCQNITFSFVDYLQTQFPRAKVSIRNGPEETVALAYARLILAKQAFAAPDSSFSVYPALATLGTGYHVAPIKASHFFKNKWVATIQNNSHVQMISETNILQSSATSNMTATQIVEWFWNDTHQVF